MQTYAGIIDDWFRELRSYRLNNSVKSKDANENGVRYTFYEWKYASRVLVIDVNETVRLFYRVDFPAWIETLCYLSGLIAYVIAIAVIFRVASADSGFMCLAGLIAFMCFNLLTMMITGRPDIFPAIVAKVLEHMADRIYWNYSERRFEKNIFQVVYDKNRCRYFAWTLINVYGGNKQLRSALDESNVIMKRLGLESRVGM